MPDDGVPESGHDQPDINTLPNGAMPFGEALKVALGRCGYTQASLAQAIDVDPMQVYRWIRGRAKPSPRHCAKLLVALGGAESPLWSDPALRVLARELGVVRQYPSHTNGGSPASNGNDADAPAPEGTPPAARATAPARDDAPVPARSRRRARIFTASALGVVLLAAAVSVVVRGAGHSDGGMGQQAGDQAGSNDPNPTPVGPPGASPASDDEIERIIPADGSPWVLCFTSGRRLPIPMTPKHGHFSWNTGGRVPKYTRVGEFLPDEGPVAIVVSLDTEIPNHPTGEIRIDFFNATGHLQQVFLTEEPTYGDQVFAANEWSLETLRFVDWNADRRDDILVVATHTGFPSFLTAVCDGERLATYFNAGHIKGLIALPDNVSAVLHSQARMASVASPVDWLAPRPPALALLVEFNDAPRCAGLVVLPPRFQSGAYPADDARYRHRDLRAMEDARYVRILPSLIAQRFKPKQNWPGNVEPWDDAGESFRLTTLETPDEHGVMRSFGPGLAMQQVAFTDAFRNDIDWEPKTAAEREALAASLETVAVRRHGTWVKIRYDKAWVTP